VLTEDARFPCDAIVLACSPAQSSRLLRGEPRRSLRWSPSAVVVHLSAARVADDLAHHTISFGGAWDGTFDEIIRRGELMSDPSLLLTTPTLTDPALAPTGRHLQYLLAPCPNLDRAPLHWDVLAHRYADELIAEMTARKLVVDAEPLAVITPDDWARDGQAAGTPFSGPTRSPRPARSARATCRSATATSCWPAAAPHRASASRRCSSPAGSQRGGYDADAASGSTVDTGRAAKVA
jgi:phytoene desaturase